MAELYALICDKIRINHRDYKLYYDKCETKVALLKVASDLKSGVVVKIIRRCK
jgi:hypothetical protein